MYGMFRNCSSLQSLDLSNFDTSNVTDMQYMFEKCSSLQSLYLSNFDLREVTEMGRMFSGCSNLEYIDASKINITSYPTPSYYNQEIFYNCSKLNHIKCKQAFKDWCINGVGYNNLPDAMKKGGTGTWEIVE